MRKLKELYGIYLLIFLLALPAVVVLRTVALFTDLAEYGHFGNDILITISDWILLGSSVFFLSYMCFGRKGIKLIPAFDTAANYIPSGLSAVAMAMLGAHLLVNAISTDLSTLSVYSRVIAFLAPALALVAVAYFVLSAVTVTRRSIRRSDFGIITLIFICMYVAYIYFDTSLPLNAPTRLSDEIAYLGAAMFFTGEIRLSLGRERWRRYTAFAFTGALVTAYSAVPNLIYYFARAKTISLSIYETLLTLAFFIFITSKIFLTPMLMKDERSGVVEKIIAAAEARATELEPTPVIEVTEESAEVAESEDADENQITIAYAESTDGEVTEAVDEGEEKEATEE